MTRFITFALIASLLLTASSSFATPNGNDRNGLITASFHKDFKTAEILSTENARNFTKLTFKMNDIVLFAYYNADGHLLAVVRNIRSNQLPIQLMLSLKQDYANYWISDLFEFNGEEGNCYYVTLEDANTKLTLRSADAGTWEVYSKKTKE